MLLKYANITKIMSMSYENPQNTTQNHHTTLFSKVCHCGTLLTLSLPCLLAISHMHLYWNAFFYGSERVLMFFVKNNKSQVDKTSVILPSFSHRSKQVLTVVSTTRVCGGFVSEVVSCSRLCVVYMV